MTGTFTIGSPGDEIVSVAATITGHHAHVCVDYSVADTIPARALWRMVISSGGEDLAVINGQTVRADGKRALGRGSASTVAGGTEIYLVPFPLGPKGDTGAAATIAVGEVLTGEPGSTATVVNSGTPTDALLDFSIPGVIPDL